MEIPVKKLAMGAVRVAAMTQLGPLAGGLFLAGTGVLGKIFADSEWAKATAEMLMHLTSHRAAEFFGSVEEGFRGLHNTDLEKSMHQAARIALQHLAAAAPRGFKDWFEIWDKFLKESPTREVFAAASGIDPVALEYDDAQFRALWWTRMEPVLIGWRNAQSAGLKPHLPEELAAFLRERLPEAMQEAHRDVLRDNKLERSWIAFQEHVYHDTLKSLHKISTQLDRIEAKIDGKFSPGKIWSIPRAVDRFQDRPDLIEQIDHALEKGSVTALTALHGLGGIGKTQLARRFAELRRDRYAIGVYVESENEASLLAGRLNLASVLHEQGHRDEARREIDLALQIFRKTLPAEHPYVRKAEEWRETIYGISAGS